MKIDSLKVSVFAIFVVMIAAVGLQISVFLDPQNNLATGGVTSMGMTLLSSSPVVLTFSGLLLLVIGYSIFRIVKE